MLVRLAFSVATAIEPEILIVDEALSAGDLSFQAKAQQRMKALISHAQAVVVVSHDLDSLTTDLQPHPLARPRADPHVGPGQRGHSRLRAAHGRGCADGRREVVAIRTSLLHQLRSVIVSIMT